jgi:Ca-activated chloride channel family protein
MRSLAAISLTVVCSAAVWAQSGRQKPSPTPPPRSIIGPSVLTAAKPTPVPDAPVPVSTPKPDTEEVIRVDASLVPIPVAVTDSDGRPVSAIKLENFVLKINGKPAEISELTRSETPISLAMLFDNSSSVLIARDFETQAAVRFFRRVIRPDRDVAALFSVADYTRLEQPFTPDVSRLTKAIEQFPPPKGATALLDGIIEAAEYLRSANGRRVLVIVSDGEDTYSDLKTTLEDVVRRLLLTDCLVYVVNTKDFENFKRTGVRGGNANTRTLTAERRMIEITQQTGGAVYSPIDDDEMAAAFTRIASELSQQYVLSYYPENDRDTRGEFRTIDVEIKGKPQLSIRARKGYYVPKR